MKLLLFGLSSTALFLIFSFEINFKKNLSRRLPANFLRSQTFNLQKFERPLENILEKIFTEEIEFNELDSQSKSIIKKAFASYFDPKFKDRQQLIDIFIKSTGLKEKLSQMSFMEEVVVRELTSSINLIKDIGPIFWNLSDPREMKKAARAAAEEGAQLVTNGEGLATFKRLMVEDISQIGGLAIRRGARSYLTNFFDDIFSKPGMAIPRENAKLELFIDFVHDLELYKMTENIDELSKYSNLLFLKLSSEFQVIARQLEGLSKTPGGLFLHIELKSALSLFLQELKNPEDFLNRIEQSLPDHLDDITKGEMISSLDSLKKGVRISSNLLKNNAQEGLIKKGLRFGFGHILTTGDELSLGLHLFRHYGNDLLTRENDHTVLKGARLLLNTSINSAAYTGKGAGFILEKTYQYIGSADPNFSTAVSAVKATITGILSPINTTKSLTNDCFKSMRNIFKRSPTN